MKKRLVALLTATLMGTLCLVGCGSTKETATEGTTEEAVVEESSEAEVAEAVEEETQMETEETETTEETEEVATDETKDTAILVVSFGTSYNDSRDVTIGAIENVITEAFPEYEVRRAFTSQIIIDILEEREGMEIDNVEEALDRAVADGIKTLVVQPTHLMDGFEYTD